MSQLIRLLRIPSTGARLHESLVVTRPMRQLVPKPLRRRVRLTLLPLSPPSLTQRFWRLLPLGADGLSLHYHHCPGCDLGEQMADPIDAVIAVLASLANPFPGRTLYCACFPQLMKWTRRGEAVLRAIVNSFNAQSRRQWNMTPVFAAVRLGSTGSVVMPDWVISVWEELF